MTAPHLPYWCPTSKSVECCPEHSGWDVCCDRPELHATGKLVRDKVPRRIYHGGGRPILHIASPEEYRQRLRDKLREEVEEFLDSDDPRELADVLEVLRCLADEGVGWTQVEAWRLEKAHERGGFAGRIVWMGNEGDGQ